MAAIAGILLALVLAGTAAAVPGELDGSFSTDGKATTNLTAGYDYAIGLVIQDDAKLVAAGSAPGNGGRFALVRYDSDGPLDSGFGGGDGKVLTNFTSGLDIAYDLVQLPDGKLLAAGRAGGGGGRFALARYTSDGSLDTTFGDDGKVTTDFTVGDDYAFSAALDGNGKYVAAGRAAGSGGRIAVARYNFDGSLDTTFGGDGKVTTNLTAGDDRADQVSTQSLGPVVAGTAGYFSRNALFAVVRYNEDGTLDTTFSSDGKVTTDFTPGFDGAFGVAIQPADDKIVAAGQAGERVGLVRYNADGTLDNDFSDDGKTTTDFSGGLDYADDVVRSSAKFIIAGTANLFGRDPKFALARYNSDGTLDTTFGGDGKVTTNFTSGYDAAYDVEIQPAGGKIVAAGAAGTGGARFAIARYLAE